MKMKKINYQILLYSLLMTFIVIGCKEHVDPAPSDHDQRVELLAKIWVVKNATNSVTLNATDEIANWPGFSVTFTDSKTYTATNISPQRLGTIWSSSGTWEFKSSTDLNTIVRDDGVEISIVVDDNNLTMSFAYFAPGGRVIDIAGLNGIDGSWVFNMQSGQ